MTSMIAFAISHYNQKNLEKMTLPIPTINETEVLIEIHAASVNPVDFKIRDGKIRYLQKYKMPLVLGNDFSGVVTQVGEKVLNFKPGDAVYGRPRKTKIGTFTEYIGIDQADIAIMPKNLSFEEAASLPLVGLTSYQALHEIMALKPNDKILIQRGAGGIGTFAIQLAKHLGAQVATTASPAGYDLVKRLGADVIVNYRKEDFSEVLTDYDYVYDTQGGTSLEKSFKIVKPKGKIVSISGLPDKRFAMNQKISFWKKWAFNLVSLSLKTLEKSSGVEYHFLFMHPSGKQLEIITKLVEKGIIKPVIDSVYPFLETQQALNHSEAGRAKGKVIVKIK